MGDATVTPAGVRQKYLSFVGTPQQVFQMATQAKAKGTARWWSKFDVVMVEDAGVGEKLVRLRCIYCENVMSAVNPARIAGGHFRNDYQSCVGVNGRSSKRRSSTEHPASSQPAASRPISLASAAVGSSSRKSNATVDLTEQAPTKRNKPLIPRSRGGNAENTIDRFVVPAENQRKAIRHLSMFFFRNPVALSLIEDEDLAASFRALGTELPGRKQLSNALLDEAYEQVKAEVLTPQTTKGLFAISSDGWRKNAASQGSPLININLLSPGGGASFVRVVRCAGVTKDASWIKELHLKEAQTLTGGQLDRIIGFLMDNTQANRNALLLLERVNPLWLGIGCQAHGLSLLCKDVTVGSKKQQQTQLAKAFNMARNMVNLIGDSERVRELVQRCQKERYGQHQAFRSPCETRFATNVLTAMDVLANKDAICDAALHDDWGDATMGGQNANDFHESAVGHGTSFWRHLSEGVQLLKPVCDAIHMVEADQPLLSQMLGMWKLLNEHARNWQQEADTTVTANYHDIFNARYKKIYHPAMPAAHVLDPANFVHDVERGTWRPPCATLTPQQREDALSVVTRLSGACTNAQKEVVSAEWGEYSLRALPQSLHPYMPYLTARRLVDEGKSTQRTALPPASERLGFWIDYAKTEFPFLSKAAERLLGIHVTTCAAERNWSLWGTTFLKCQNALALERAEKLIFIRGNSKQGKNSDEGCVDMMVELLAQPADD